MNNCLASGWPQYVSHLLSHNYKHTKQLLLHKASCMYIFMLKLHRGPLVERRFAMLQAAYNAIPYALSPVLGNPLALAAVNVDRSASLPAQVCCHHITLSLSFPLPACTDVG